MRRRLRAVAGPLWLLLALSAVLAVAWATVVPPLTNADEAGHFAYVQHLAETGSAPSAHGTRTYSEEEATFLAGLGVEAITGNPNGRPVFSPEAHDRFADYERNIGHEQRADGDGPNQFAQNGPLYYSLGAIAYRLTPGGRLVDRVFAVRMVGGLLFVGIVAMTWLLAAELFAATWPRALAASAVALQPRLANTAASVNPDILLAALWTAFALVAVRTVRHGITVRRGVTLGLLTGASSLTHGRGLALVVPLAVVLLISVPRPRVNWRRLVRPAAIAGAIVAVCVAGGVLYTRSKAGTGYGGELTVAVGGHSLSAKGFLAYVFNFYFGSYQALGPLIGEDFGFRQGYIETFFSSLGSLDIVFLPHILDYLQFLAVAGLVVLWTQVIWFRDRLRRRWREVAVLAVLCVAQIGLLHVASYRHLVGSGDSGVLWTGRYLLPLIAVFGVTIAYVCSHLPRRLAPLAAGGVLAVGIALQLGSLGLTLDRFFG